MTKKQIERESKQPRFEAEKPGDPLGSVSYLVDWVYRSHLVEPEFSTDTRKYDDFLYDLALNEPHLIGVLSQVISKDTNRAWYLTGGVRMVRKFAERLHNVEGGDGWRHFISMQARSFYTANIGAITEIETLTGRPGDEMTSLYHVDPTETRLLNNWERPLRYYPSRGRVQDWYRDEFFRTVSMPDGREKWRGIGISAVNRCLSLAKMLIAVYEHDLEQLGASPPRGFLVGDNITKQQFDIAKAERERAKENGDLEFDLLALFSTSAGKSTDIRFVPYSSLPTNFDLEQFTYLIMLGYALAFGYDAQEFYPIKGGSFGRGAEAEIQATKTTYKGEADFSLQYQNHVQGTLPDSLLFEFDRNDVNGDILLLNRDKAVIENVSGMYAPSNRQQGETGLISRIEAREYLVEHGVAPPEWLENPEPEMQTDDTNDQTDPDQETDNDADPVAEQNDNDPTERIRRKYRDNDALVRYAEKHGNEPICRLEYNPKNGHVKSVVLWQSGDDLRGLHRNWRGYSLPSKSELKKRDNSGVFRDPFLAYVAGHDSNCDCGHCVVQYIPRNLDRFAEYVPIKRAESGETLYEDGGVLITTGDVDLAIVEAYALNPDFGDLLSAQIIERMRSITMRAFSWDESARRYRYENGQFVSAARVRELTTESLDDSIDRVAALAAEYDNGALNLNDFHAIAREEIKRNHIRQYIAGRGGRDQMTPSDWGRVGRQLRDQYDYLDGFIADIDSKNLTVGQIQTRLQMYINAGNNAYWSGYLISQGLPANALPAVPGDGSTVCLTNCRCYWRQRDWIENGVLVGYKFTWVLTAVNNCVTCADRAGQWIDIEVRFSEN